MLLTQVEASSINYNEVGKGMEHFFISSYNGWDLVDSFALYFYDAILAIELPNYPIGSKILGLCIDFNQCVATFDITEDLSLTYRFSPTSLTIK